jgi:hypothetical protein
MATRDGKSLPPVPVRTVEKYWLLIKRSTETECWIWTGHLTPAGYGNISIGPRGNARNVLAHRLSYFLHTGEDPGSRFVLHRCDTPACVRPDHLFLGSQADMSTIVWLRDASIGG